MEFPIVMPVISLDGAVVHLIKKDDIVHINREVNNIFIQTHNGRYKMLTNVEHMRLFLGEEFIQVDQGWLVRKDEIVEYVSGRQSVLLKSGESIKVARPRVQGVKDLMAERDQD